MTQPASLTSAAQAQQLASPAISALFRDGLWVAYREPHLHTLPLNLADSTPWDKKVA